MTNAHNTNHAVELTLVNLKDLIISPNLTKDDRLPLARFTPSLTDYYTSIYPPFVMQDNSGKYHIIGRHWSYRLLVENSAKDLTAMIPCEVVHEKSLQNLVMKYDKSEIHFLEAHMKGTIKKTSKATLARHRAINAGRCCPICADALMKPRGKPIKDVNGYYTIHCYQTKNGRCDFVGQLTELEYVLFCKYELQTESWIKPVNGARCLEPDCGGDIFLRVLKFPDKTVAFECCINYKNSTKHKCTNKKRITHEGPNH